MSQSILPILDERIKGFGGLGLVHVVTGNGKGKTTGALGLAVRAVGAGLKVGIVYFDKGGNTHYSERKVLDTILKGSIEYVATGRDRIDPITGRFDFSIIDIDRSEAKRGLDVARAMSVRSDLDLVILDEINSTVTLGMLDEKDVLDLIQNKKPTTELVLTGRNAPQSFLDSAHLVSEVTLKKHYFYSGVSAREGIDY